jgi:hypothetical protein
MKYRSVRAFPSFGAALISAFTLAACGAAGDGNDLGGPTTNDEQSTSHSECPNLCVAICSGGPVPELPDGCPTPICAPCDHPGDGPACPDICSAICAGEPAPELPESCPTPACSCD